MRENAANNQQSNKYKQSSGELRKPNQPYPPTSYPAMNDSLKEDEMKFHQSQNHTHHQNSSIQSMPFANSNSGPSRMKINSMQDSFLNNCRHDRTVIEISLVDQTREIGVIVGFDVNTLIMENEDKYQFLIMKSAIIKIKPTKFVNYIFNDNYKYMNVLFDYSGEKDVGG